MTSLSILALLGIIVAGQSTGSAAPLQRTNERVVHSFGPSGDGAYPTASLIADQSGALYGTTFYGGVKTACQGNGCGTVFKLTPTGGGFTETVLYRFADTGDGASPDASLLLGHDGTLYGTTSGNTDDGNVFALAPSGNGYKESVIYHFHGADGRDPETALTSDASGNLFGTTEYGGAQNFGTVFELKRVPDGFSYVLLYSFPKVAGDGYPRAPLLLGPGGVLYGGATAAYYKLTPSQNGYVEETLYSFTVGKVNGLISTPISGIAGYLLGTSRSGGKTYDQYGNTRGVIYALQSTPNGFVETNAHEFGRDDGNLPTGQLVSKGGTLFGVTQLGGLGQGNSEYRNGVVFKMVPNRQRYDYSIVHVFEGAEDGAQPFAGLCLAPSGKLYGTTTGGGIAGQGTAFEITP